MWICAGCAGAAIAEDWDRPSLGLRAMPIERYEAALKKLGKLPSRQGLIVLDVAPGTPAAAGGLKKMDVITTVNRKTVGTMEELEAIVSQLGVGAAVSIGGYGLTPANVWKAGTVKARVIRHREMLEAWTTRTTDDVRRVDIIRHVDAPSGDRESVLSLYIAVVGDETRLKLRVAQVGGGWVFPTLLTVQVHDENHEFKLPFELRKTDVWGGGNTTEIYDITITPELMPAIEAIAKTMPSVIRVEGREQIADREMGIDEHDHIATMLDVYRMMTEVK
jgi:hypothetical protein